MVGGSNLLVVYAATLVLLSFVAPTIAQQEFYVSESSTEPPESCLGTIEQPCPSIGKLLDRIQNTKFNSTPTIFVLPGVYTEKLIHIQLSVRLIATGGLANTILDCHGNPFQLTFTDSHQTSYSFVVDGFTIQNCQAPANYMIFMHRGVVHLRNMLLKSNVGQLGFSEDSFFPRSSVFMENVTIENSELKDGMTLSLSKASFRNVILRQNSAPRHLISAYYASRLDITNMTVEDMESKAMIFDLATGNISIDGLTWKNVSCSRFLNVRDSQSSYYPRYSMELANMIIRDNDDAQDCEMIRLDFTDTFINDLWISNITVINAGVNMVKSNKGPMYFRVENLKASTNWQGHTASVSLSATSHFSLFNANINGYGVVKVNLDGGDSLTLDELSVSGLGSHRTASHFSWTSTNETRISNVHIDKCDSLNNQAIMTSFVGSFIQVSNFAMKDTTGSFSATASNKLEFSGVYLDGIETTGLFPLTSQDIDIRDLRVRSSISHGVLGFYPTTAQLGIDSIKIQQIEIVNSKILGPIFSLGTNKASFFDLRNVFLHNSTYAYFGGLINSDILHASGLRCRNVSATSTTGQLLLIDAREVRIEDFQVSESDITTVINTKSRSSTCVMVGIGITDFRGSHALSLTCDDITLTNLTITRHTESSPGETVQVHYYQLGYARSALVNVTMIDNGGTGTLALNPTVANANVTISSSFFRQNSLSPVITISGNHLPVIINIIDTTVVGHNSPGVEVVLLGEIGQLIVQSSTFETLAPSWSLLGTDAHFLDVHFNNAPIVLQGGDATFTRVHFSSATSSAVVIHGASRFHDCTFDNNQSALNGGAVESTVCDVQFINTTFTNNRAAGAGGAVYFEVQDIKKKCKPDQFFYNTTFLGNVAADYGNDSATNPAEGILPYKNAPPATIRPGERFSIRVASNDLFKQRCKGEHINFQGSAKLSVSGDAYFGYNDTSRTLNFAPDGTLDIPGLVLFGQQYSSHEISVHITGNYNQDLSSDMGIVRCPPGHYPQDSLDKNTNCVACQKFLYSLDGKECRPCPLASEVCASVDMDGKGMYVAAGNWPEPTPISLSNATFINPVILSQCSTKGCSALRCALVCIGLDCYTECSPCFENPVAYSDSLLATIPNCSLCVDGYQGRQCSQCSQPSDLSQPRRYRSGSACIECTTANLPISFVVIGVVVIVAVAGYFILRRLELSGILKTVIFFVQTRQALQSTEFNLTSIRLGAIEFANFDMQGLECLFPALEPGSWSRLLFVMITPLVVLGALILIALIVQLSYRVLCRRKCSDGNLSRLTSLQKDRKPTETSSKITKVFALIGKAIVTVALLAYFAESTYALNMLRCESEYVAELGATPRSFLVKFPWQTCDRSDPNYSIVWKLAAISIVVYTVTVPILSGVLLLVNRKAILAGSPAVEQWLGGLYDSYKPRFFWYELIYFARKVLLAIFIALLEGTPRSAAIIGLLQIATVIQLLLHPFKGAFQNGLEVLALVALTWNYAVATVAGLSGDVYVGVVCLVLDGVVMAGCVIAFVKPLAEKVKQKCCSPRKSKPEVDPLLVSETDDEVAEFIET